MVVLIGEIWSAGACSSLRPLRAGRRKLAEAPSAIVDGNLASRIAQQQDCCAGRRKQALRTPNCSTKKHHSYRSYVSLFAKTMDLAKDSNRGRLRRREVGNTTRAPNSVRGGRAPIPSHWRIKRQQDIISRRAAEPAEERLEKPWLVLRSSVQDSGWPGGLWVNQKTRAGSPLCVPCGSA